MSVKKVFIFIAVLIAFIYIGCKTAKLRFPLAPVVLISMDTTRADHLSCYGYKYKTTPNIDSLARDGITFKNVISHVPLTLPSHSSVFTGKYPFHLNVKDNGGYFLDESEETIAEVLSQSKYITAGIIGAFVLHSKWGIKQGFQFYDDDVSTEAYQAFSLVSIDRPAHIVSSKAIAWLNNYDNKSPFFLFIHFFDPHAPYHHHNEFKDLFSNAYDEEIAYMDFHIGKILYLLKEKNIYDKSLIIAFGDHGEGLGEHGENAHGLFLYDSTLKVPLIIKLPYNKSHGKIVQQQVQLVDIMPTILDCLGINRKLKLDGISLIDLVLTKYKDDEYDTKRFAYSETYFPLLHYGWSPLFSARTNKFKYIKAPKPELYDLIKDDKEKSNIIQINRNISSDYEKFIDKITAVQNLISSPVKISAEDQEKLKALGYASLYKPGDLKGELPDPKDKILIFQSLELAKESLENLNFKDAIIKLNYIIDNDPNIVEAWFVLGNAYAHLQQYSDAINAFEKAYSLYPSNTYVIFNLAHAYQKMNDYEKALLWYEKAIALDEKFFKALVSAGEICFFHRDYQKALDYFQKALQIKKDVPALYNYIAGIYIAKNNIPLAKQFAFEAYKMNRNLPFLNFYLGVIYEKEGDIDRAINAYQEELRINPNNYSAMNNLGILYIGRNNYDGAESIFRQLIKLTPYQAKSYLLLANVLMRKNGDPKEIQELIKKYEQVKNKSAN